ncbi:MAG: sodium-dependent transporter [Gammaproteobacteria bacterium]|nr:sodium-dependent transporter [Gammaproteobacteria bacterium]
MLFRISSLTEKWSSKWTFIFACASASVGLGNIWKFPYSVGENGGGDFVITYLICVIFVGFPLLIAEIVIGRRGQENPVDAMRNLALSNGLSKYWEWVGWLGIFSAFFIFSYYNVIGAWTIDYIINSLNGTFQHISSDKLEAHFNVLISTPSKLLLYYSGMIVFTALVIMRGLNKGIEKIVLIFFPLMILILLSLIIYSIMHHYFQSGFDFVFRPNFFQFTRHTILSAMYEALFSLGVGMGIIMMYGAYLPSTVSIRSMALWITFIDVSVALLAALAIFPIVFAHGIDPTIGPSLIFKSIPLAFSALPGGRLMSAAFFFMLAMASITATIGLLEPIVALLIKRTSLNRIWATLLASLVLWIVGLFSLFSFNIWSAFKIFNRNFFELIDYVLAHFILSLSGLLLAIFVTWFLNRSQSQAELHLKPMVFNIWFYTLRYITSFGIIIIVITSFM